MLTRSIARTNRFWINPLVRLVAGRAPGFAIVRHQGRRSGREYATPINIFRVPSGYLAALTYGRDTDWLKNLTAAGGGTIRYRGRDVQVGAARFVPTSEGRAAVPAPVRGALHVLNVTDFVRWQEVDTAESQSLGESSNR